MLTDWLVMDTKNMGDVNQTAWVGYPLIRMDRGEMIVLCYELTEQRIICLIIKTTVE